MADTDASQPTLSQDSKTESTPPQDQALLLTKKGQVRAGGGSAAHEVPPLECRGVLRPVVCLGAIGSPRYETSPPLMSRGLRIEAL